MKISKFQDPSSLNLGVYVKTMMVFSQKVVFCVYRDIFHNFLDFEVTKDSIWENLVVEVMPLHQGNRILNQMEIMTLLQEFQVFLT